MSKIPFSRNTLIMLRPAPERLAEAGLCRRWLSSRHTFSRRTSGVSWEGGVNECKELHRTIADLPA